MDKNNYTFERFEQELDQGFQFKCTYVNNQYIIFKTTDDCYTQKLLSVHPKNPQPRMAMITYTRIKEMFPFLENIEYVVHDDD